jgi:enoyl-CoA hydratase
MPELPPTPPESPVVTSWHGRVTVVTLQRRERRNAVDARTAEALLAAFRAFDADSTSDVAMLTGAGGAFCAGADLQALAAGEAKPIHEAGDVAPMGPTRLRLGKPVIAAIEGPAVAGGMELALWCDLRVAGESAVMGIFNRRFGVPLVDLGTIRLPRLIGEGRALDLLLTGRPVKMDEALAIGLVSRVVPNGTALEAAVALAEQIASFPQVALRGDRLSVYEQWDLHGEAAVANEVRRGLRTIESGEAHAGSHRFAEGAGRHGAFEGPPGLPAQSRSAARGERRG